MQLLFLYLGGRDKVYRKRNTDILCTILTIIYTRIIQISILVISLEIVFMCFPTVMFYSHPDRQMLHWCFVLFCFPFTSLSYSRTSHICDYIVGTLCPASWTSPVYDSSVLLCVLVVCSFLLLSNIPLYN